MKNRKLIVFVSALLFAVMALSSCTGSAALPNNDALANDPMHENSVILTDGEGVSLLSSADTLSASGKLAVWQKYLKYNAKSLDAVTSDSTSFSSDKRYYRDGNYGVVVQYEDKETVGAYEELWKSIFEQTIKVYNIFGKDEPIFTYKNNYVTNIEDRTEVYSDATIARVNTDVYYDYGIFYVEYENWDAVYEELPEGSTETPEIIGYTLEEMYYEFYLADGTFLGKTENSWDYDTSSTYCTKTFILNGDAYVLDNYGNFIKKVKDILYTEDPFLEATLGSAEMTKIGGYYFVEDYYEDGYVIFDLNGSYVGKYKGESQVEIFLPNGNVLMQDVIEVNEGATVYDVYNYANDKKYNVVTKVFDVASGKTTEVDFAYKIETYYDAMSAGNTVLAGDCAVIEAYTFEKQMYSSELTYVALNSDLTVKEILPEIIPNQVGLVKMCDADTTLIPATMYGGDSEFYYRVTDGSFFAYDYIIKAPYPGMLIVDAEDEDGNYCRDLIDYSGKVIVHDFEYNNINYMRNENGEPVSLLLRVYDEEDERTSLVLCYYDAANDSVVSKTIAAVDADDARISNTYSYLDGRVMCVITYDYEDENYYVKFINAKGDILANFYSDYASSSSSFSYSYDEYSKTYSIQTYGDSIVIKETSQKNNRNDYIRYTTIK